MQVYCREKKMFYSNWYMRNCYTLHANAIEYMPAIFFWIWKFTFVWKLKVDTKMSLVSSYWGEKWWMLSGKCQTLVTNLICSDYCQQVGSLPETNISRFPLVTFQHRRRSETVALSAPTCLSCLLDGYQPSPSSSTGYQPFPSAKRLAAFPIRHTVASFPESRPPPS